MSTNYDTVIIGSGIGGLTCGAFLARGGMKVLVLERHSQIGGYAHGFKRRSFRFEPAIHSVAMAPDGLVFHLLRLLGVDKKIRVIPHSSMFRCITPDTDFVMPGAAGEIRRLLGDSFPRERDALAGIFGDMQRFYDTLLEPVFNFETELREQDRSFLAPYLNKSYRDYISSFISDQALRNIFFCQWPFTGSSPGYSPVTFNLLMFYVHFLEGSHYVEGGFASLANALASVILEKGGAILTRKEARSLRVERDRVCAVIDDTGAEYEASAVVSNISPLVLHGELLDERSRNKLWLRRVRNLNPSVSAVAVYLGLRERLSGAHDGVTLWYAHNDHEKIFSRVLREGSAAPDHLLFLKAPSSCDPRTLLVMTFAQKSHSTTWHEEKKKIAEGMIQKAREVFPEIKDTIEVTEIGSPSTFERYTRNTGGALYGFENTKILYGEAKMPFRTHLRNLYQVGHWGKPGGGVWNVMQNSYTGAKLILNSPELLCR